MAEPFDAAIIGGGPAGATIALLLARRGWSVCLFEATAFDEERYGETLPPEINPLLRELGLYGGFLATGPLESPGNVSCWGSNVPAEQDFLRNPHGPGWHVDRNRFDRMLYDQAEAAGAQCFLGSRAEPGAPAPDLWTVGDCRARFLVDASGRNGLRMPADAGREVDDRLIAIALPAVHPAGASPDLRTYIESAPAGWWYSAPLPDGRSIVMFFTDAALYARAGIVLEEQLDPEGLTTARLRGAELPSSTTLHVSSSCRRVIAGDGWLAAGDSASSYDPISGRGIFNALRQSARAALAMESWLRGEPQPVADYAAFVHSEFNHYLRQRRAYYAAEQRWPDEEFWRLRSVAAP